MRALFCHKEVQVFEKIKSLPKFKNCSLRDTKVSAFERNHALPPLALKINYAILVL